MPVPVQVLFPMGGLGSRFSAVGIDTPKPLIPLTRDDGLPMILKAVSSFKRLQADDRVSLQLLFVVRKEHNEKMGLQAEIEKMCPGAKFSVLDHDTRGAVESCLIAEPLIHPEHPLIVMDCDLYFQSKEYEETLLTMTEQKLSGLLLYFNSKAPRYSYAQLDDNHNVVRTAEKVPISPNALIGAYGFGSGAIFLDAAHRLMEKEVGADGMKEYYLSLLYNILLEENQTTAATEDSATTTEGGMKHRIRAVPMDEYHSFGTPDEMEQYNAGKRSYMLE